VQDFRLRPQCGWRLRSSGGGCRVTKDGSWIAPFSRQHISPTFKGQALQKHVNYLTLRDGNGTVSPQKSGNEQTTHDTQESKDSKDTNFRNIIYCLHFTAFSFIRLWIFLHGSSKTRRVFIKMLHKYSKTARSWQFCATRSYNARYLQSPSRFTCFQVGVITCAESRNFC